MKRKNFVIVRADNYLAALASLGSAIFYSIFFWDIFLIISLVALAYYLGSLVRDWQQPWTVFDLGDGDDRQTL